MACSDCWCCWVVIDLSSLTCPINAWCETMVNPLPAPTSSPSYITSKKDHHCMLTPISSHAHDDAQWLRYSYRIPSQFGPSFPLFLFYTDIPFKSFAALSWLPSDKHSLTDLYLFTFTFTHTPFFYSRDGLSLLNPLAVFPVSRKLRCFLDISWFENVNCWCQW